MTVPTQDIDRARQIAAAATPGPWHVDERGECSGVTVAHVGDFYDVCADALFDGEAEGDARFVAAFSPDVVDGMLVELVELRRQNGEAGEALALLGQMLGILGVTREWVAMRTTGADDAVRDLVMHAYRSASS